MRILRYVLLSIAICTTSLVYAIEPTIVWHGGLKYWVRSWLSGDTTAVLLHKSAEVSIINSYIQSIYYPSDSNYVDLPPRLIIPDSIEANGKKYPVSSISNKAFSGTDLHEIVLPKTITSIGTESFARCTNCSDIILPKTYSDIAVGGLFGGGFSTANSPYYSATKRLQFPKQTHFYGFEDEMYSYIYYSPLQFITHLFCEEPVNIMQLLQLEKNILPYSRIKYYGLMTHDESQQYVNLSSAYSIVKGYGLWGGDVVTTNAEELVNVPIELNRLDPITSVSFELVLPSDISLNNNSLVLNAERITDHQVTISNNQITITSPTQTRLNGCDSTLLTLRLPIANYDIVLTDITMTSIDGEVFVQDNDTIRIGEGSHQEVPHYDITDVNRTINQMLGRNSIATMDCAGVTFQMVAVEGGSFIMGDPNYQQRGKPDNYKPHEVMLDTYLIANTEVTTELWNSVMDDKETGYAKAAILKKWDDWNVFIAKLNNLTGFNFRMPTEAEWEFAARGGNKTHNYDYSGCNSNEINQYGWVYQTKPYEDNTYRFSYPVGMLLPNELGLYDMSGNVDEACHDWFGAYTSYPEHNPTGPQTGTYHVFRGGNCYIGPYAQTARVYDRCQPDLNEIIQDSWAVGLRLCMNGSTLPYDKSCDYNNDGQVNIVDVNHVINKMLGK